MYPIQGNSRRNDAMINYDLKKIKLLAFDIDGVLSASTITVGDDGQALEFSNINDVLEEATAIL